MIDTSHSHLPDFIIVGAMKCGTTSLYATLQRHPDIYFPPLEVGFFDVDDIRQHPDFFKFSRDRWQYQPFRGDDEESIQWYRDLFDAAQPRQIKGERSVTYMASTLAPARIRSLVPSAKIIFMLRDPVPRAYSNYWHLLRSGDATGSFEQSLRYRHNALFERGLYRSQVERYLDSFPRNQLMFIIFEEYMEDPEGTLQAVYEFLGVETKGFETGPGGWENRGRYPWSQGSQYLINRVFFHGLLDGHRYLDAHLPHLRWGALSYNPLMRGSIKASTFLFKAFSRVNCSKRKRPKMRPETLGLLKYLYETHNEGLSSLLGKDLSDIWAVTKV